MSLRVEIAPDPSQRPGYALIRIVGGATLPRPFHFRLRRDGWEKGVLGPAGWQVADAEIVAEPEAASGGDLIVKIGPEVTQFVEAGVYLLSIPAAETEVTAFWPNIPLVPGGTLNRVVGRSPPPIASQQSDMPQVSSAASAPGGGDDTVVMPPEPPLQRSTQPPRRGGRGWLVLLALALAAAAAGGGYYAYLQWHHPEPPVPSPHTPPTQPQPAPPATARPAAALDLSNMRVADAIASGATSEALLQEAERRLQAGKLDDALQLMEVAADRNLPAAHAALGRFYDPNQPHPPGVKPDARQAALHYRAAERGGDGSVGEPRNALKTFLEQRQQHDDLYAPLILKEFWP